MGFHYRSNNLNFTFMEGVVICGETKKDKNNVIVVAGELTHVSNNFED